MPLNFIELLWFKVKCIWQYLLQSYDATTHFETTMIDVLAMYTKITGKVCFFHTFNLYKRTPILTWTLLSISVNLSPVVKTNCLNILEMAQGISSLRTFILCFHAHSTIVSSKQIFSLQSYLTMFDFKHSNTWYYLCSSRNLTWQWTWVLLVLVAAKDKFFTSELLGLWRAWATLRSKYILFCFENRTWWSPKSCYSLIFWHKENNGSVL